MNFALVLAAMLSQAATPSPAPVVGQQSAQDIWDKRCVLCHGAGSSRDAGSPQGAASDGKK